MSNNIKNANRKTIYVPLSFRLFLSRPSLPSLSLTPGHGVTHTFTSRGETDLLSYKDVNTFAMRTAFWVLRARVTSILLITNSEGCIATKPALEALELHKTIPIKAAHCLQTMKTETTNLKPEKTRASCLSIQFKDVANSTARKLVWERERKRERRKKKV